GGALHDLASEAALQLIVEAAPEEQKTAPAAQFLYARRNGSLNIDFGQHFNEVGIRYQVILGRRNASDRLVKQRVPLCGRLGSSRVAVRIEIAGPAAKVL